MSYYIIIGAVALISWLVSNTLKRKFAYYSKVSLSNNMSGKEIAEKMLQDHGITDVSVVSTAGRLTDHYNPLKKTVNLSESVYQLRNTAAAAVAAHEVGHAVQHARAYQWLMLRSKLVPVTSIASKMSTLLVIGGIILHAASGFGIIVSYIGLLAMAVATLFSFITLPVEYDASNRALKWLKSENMLTETEQNGAKDALKWAARTYLVAALSSLAMLLYWAFRILASRD